MAPASFGTCALWHVRPLAPAPFGFLDRDEALGEVLDFFGRASVLEFAQLEGVSHAMLDRMMADDRIGAEQQGRLAEIALGPLAEDVAQARSRAEDYLAALVRRRDDHEVDELRRAAVSAPHNESGASDAAMRARRPERAARHS